MTSSEPTAGVAQLFRLLNLLPTYCDFLRVDRASFSSILARKTRVSSLLLPDDRDFLDSDLSPENRVINLFMRGRCLEFEIKALHCIQPNSARFGLCGCDY